MDQKSRNLKLAPSENRGKVLIVDDDDDVVELLSEIVSTQGYQTETAFNGDEALEMFQKSKPNLVITDVLMPGISGIDLAKKLKEIDSSIPVILISGKYLNLIEDLINRKIIADQVLYKPIASSDIIESMGLLLEN